MYFKNVAPVTRQTLTNSVLVLLKSAHCMNLVSCKYYFVSNVYKYQYRL